MHGKGLKASFKLYKDIRSLSILLLHIFDHTIKPIARANETPPSPNFLAIFFKADFLLAWKQTNHCQVNQISSFFAWQFRNHVPTFRTSLKSCPTTRFSPFTSPPSPNTHTHCVVHSYTTVLCSMWVINKYNNKEERFTFVNWNIQRLGTIKK